MTLRYRDTIVSRNSDLYRALEAGDGSLASRIYTEANAEFAKFFQGFEHLWQSKTTPSPSSSVATSPASVTTVATTSVAEASAAS
ncbi:protein of unknown function [Cupriavidus taiwanensis]|nr:protein of unknown function [Cupriavidus taiwanensis]